MHMFPKQSVILASIFLIEQELLRKCEIFPCSYFNVHRESEYNIGIIRIREVYFVYFFLMEVLHSAVQLLSEDDVSGILSKFS